MKDLRIFDRPINRVVGAFLDTRKIASLISSLYLIDKPFRFIHHYLWFQSVALKEGESTVTVKTPTGKIDIEVKSSHDYVTILEIFCRKDYKIGARELIIMDVGSNIGISACYFLTRNLRTRVICYEPNPNNIRYLEANTAKFGRRVLYNDYALADHDGTAMFAQEATGRYGSLLVRADFDGEMIEVAVRDIRTEVRSLIKQYGSIDLIKLDTEGTEEFLLEILTNLGILTACRLIAEDNRGGLIKIFLS